MDDGSLEEALPDFLMKLTGTLPKMLADTREEQNGQKVRVMFLTAPTPAPQSSALAHR